MATYITKEGLKQSLMNYTNSLKSWLGEWLPIKKQTNDSNEEIIAIQSPSYKNVMEIDIDGNIIVLGTDRDPVKLQERLDKVGTIVVETFEEAEQYLIESNLGRLVYVKNANETMVEGLYSIVINASNHGSLLLSKIGTTTGSTEDLGARVDALENFVKNPMTNDEINIITNK